MSRSSPFASGPGPAAVYFAYRGGAWLAEHTPPAIADRIAAWGGRIAYKRAEGKRRTVERNLARVVGEGPNLDETVKAAFGSYAEYWLETFRLGRYSHDELLSMVEPVGDSVAVIEEAIAAKEGALLITPHLGFYDLGVAWVGAKGWAFTTVAEVLRPKALFEWFAQIRRRHGLTVLPARNGKSIRVRLGEVLDSGGLVALVSDRDLGRRGIWVEFFGERTTFPASPTLLLVEKKVPLIAGSITRHGDRFRLQLEKVPYTLTGDKEADISAVAQVTANALEKLIRAAPEQWHLFSTNWPSDEPHLPPRGREADPGALPSEEAPEAPKSDPPQVGEVEQ
ncbi:MAG TPA: phosphatidylinositol mannoside acyltransferase [Actinomycetota bacterium]|nr:phosphatidylinositol mannoside acyltransferase [Actinomycetota bacterium]